MRNYIRLRSGRCFNLVHPQFHANLIPDVAYHLAGINRYTGGSRFSVAQHCVVGAWMAEMFYPQVPRLAARFLVHDATEFAYGDISSPLKRLIPGYVELEERAQLAVEDAFEILFVADEEVKEIDIRMWLTERLMVYMDAECSDEELAADYIGPLEPFDLSVGEFLDHFSPWDADAAAEIYEREFHRLLPWVVA